MREASPEFSTKRGSFLHVFPLGKVAKSILPFRERPIALLFGERSVGANAVATLTFRPVKGGIGYFDELDRVARIARKRCDANTYRHVMCLRGAPVPYHAEFLLRDGVADTFRSDQPLSEVGVKQKGCEFLAAEPRRGVAAS